MSADVIPLPPSLGTWLDEGCDLTVIPGLESYAKVIVIAHRAAPAESRERLAAHFWQNLNTWLDGDNVTMPDGEILEPSLDHIRHSMWMCEGLIDPDVAARFEAALPTEVRDVVLERLAEIEANGEEWPT